MEHSISLPKRSDNLWELWLRVTGRNKLSHADSGTDEVLVAESREVHGEKIRTKCQLSGMRYGCYQLSEIVDVQLSESSSHTTEPMDFESQETSRVDQKQCCSGFVF